MLDFYPRPYEVVEPSGDGRQQYYDALNAKIRKENFSFNRIVQTSQKDQLVIDNILQKIGDFNDDVLWEHCSLLISQNRINPKILFKVSDTVSPENMLIIIDDRIVIWTIIFVGHGGERNIESILFFDDRQQNLVKHLLTIFQRVDNDADRIKELVS